MVFLLCLPLVTGFLTSSSSLSLSKGFRHLTANHHSPSSLIQTASIISLASFLLFALAAFHRRRRVTLNDATLDKAEVVAELLRKAVGHRVPAEALRDAKFRVTGCQSAAFLRLNPDGSVDVWADALISRGIGLTVAERLKHGNRDFRDLHKSLSSGRLGGVEGFIAAFDRQMNGKNI